MRKPPSRVREIRKLLFAWYRSSARPLPWRRTRDPYRILVSEVMLQQTQVNRVLIHYRKFLKQFPTLRALSRASTANVVRAWRGMGYNNRAVRLRNLARTVCDSMGGKLPKTTEALEALPGIGRYTAGAVASFAFEKRVPVVDTNIHRVLNRLFPGTGAVAQSWELAEEILPKRNAYSWNQGLMELGALICTASSPQCSTCPLRPVCPSAFTARRTRRKSMMPERGRNGVPNRIYRGRIVEALRGLNGRGSIRSTELGKEIMVGFSSKDLPWLHNLLTGLERDGLIRVKDRSGRRMVSFAE